ncbi:hypothetical protein H0X48_04300 [Candidatus Dependentiae bacterium]|nr:hypothetical protein [Candidatus Dependentiae bacterium]
MKYISLALLCTALVLAPACGRRRTAGCAAPCYTAAPASCDSCPSATADYAAAPAQVSYERMEVTPMPQSRMAAQPMDYNQEDLASYDEESYDNGMLDDNRSMRNQDYASMNTMNEDDYIEEDLRDEEEIQAERKNKAARPAAAPMRTTTVTKTKVRTNDEAFK